MSVIVAKKLTKRFGKFVAVDNISFEIEKGEIFGFLGANGAGKTTAMRMLCGLSRPSAGKGTVAGFDIEKQSEQVKAHIGYMSQRFAMYEDLKVWENLRLYAGIYGVPRREIMPKIDRLLEDLGFISEKNTMVSALPLGWNKNCLFRRPSFISRGLFFWMSRRAGWTHVPEATVLGTDLPGS